MNSIFFIETPSHGIAHGMGTYARNLIPALSKHEDLKVYYVKIFFSDKGSVKIEQLSDRYSLIEITFERMNTKDKGEVNIPPLIARSVFCVLSPFFNEEKTPLFHLNSVLQLSFAEVARENDFKLVYTQHVSLWRILYNNDFSAFKNQWKSKEIKDIQHSFIRSIKADEQMCQLANQVICLTKQNKDFAIKFFDIPKEKISIIGNGLYLLPKSEARIESSEEIRKGLGYRDDDFIFLFVGRLTEQKGLNTLIDAFRGARLSMKNVKLLIVGGGEVEKYISLTADICAQVSFVGYSDKKKIDEYYRIANAGVLPSFTEQSSYVLIEMLSNRLPVIVSDIDAFCRPLEHEKNVIKISTNDRGEPDLKSLKDCLILLFKDDQLRESLKTNGFNTFERYFKADLMADRTREIYTKFYH